MQTCSRCRENLPATAFHVGQRYCKLCMNAYRRALPHDSQVRRRARERRATWAMTNAEKCRANRQRWKAQNPARYAEMERRKKLKQKYGLTVEEYDALLSAQAGVCAICRATSNIRGRMFAVDHCHETGVVRGLLCDHCNRALGLLRDNPAAAEQAAAYLRSAKRSR